MFINLIYFFFSYDFQLSLVNLVYTWVISFPSYVFVFEWFLLNLYCFLIWRVCCLTLFKAKLAYFAALIICTAVWCFYFSFDSLTFFFLSTEFLIITLFVIISLTSNFLKPKVYGEFISLRSLMIGVNIVYFLTVVGLDGFSLFYYSFYSSCKEVISSDLYTFYLFFFVDFTLVLVYLIIILSLFTFFFVLVYFQIKNCNSLQKRKKTFLFILKKQNILRQAVFKTQVSCFSARRGRELTWHQLDLTKKF